MIDEREAFWLFLAAYAVGVLVGALSGFAIGWAVA